MAKVAHLLRAAWAMAGVVAAILLVLASGADALIFWIAYGSPVGSYPGQAGDRQLAWRALTWLAIAWVVVLAGMIWPAIRWRRRGMYSPADAPPE